MLSLVREYLYNSEIDILDRKILLKLYLNYLKLDSLKNNHINDLNNLEDKIYYVDENYMSNLDKINLEISYYKSKNDDNKTATKIKELISIINKKLENPKLTEEDILFIKQKIVEIQILNNCNITFLEASRSLFEKYCKEIKEKIKSKK